VASRHRSETTTDPAGATRLRAVARAAAHRSRVRAILGDGRNRWLADPVADQPDPSDGSTRYAVDLEMTVGSGSARVALHKAAFVDVGPLREASAPRHALEMPISWRASSMAPLFPVFAGTLRWSAGELVLDGWYAPPLGTVGAAADRVLFRMVARRTARWLLDRIVSEMARTEGGL
jgi:hypothetical protein